MFCCSKEGSCGITSDMRMLPLLIAGQASERMRRKNTRKNKKEQAVRKRYGRERDVLQTMRGGSK